MPSTGDRAPELLRVDKEQLDRAASVLAEDQGFVLVACPRELVSAARKHLSQAAGQEIAAPLALKGSEEAFAALAGDIPEVASAKVRSLTLGGERKEALRSLNWHREKLLRGAPVVLWLDGVDGLTEMREVAPDAYSFREIVVLLRGDGGRLPQTSSKESRRVLDARRRRARAKTAQERAEAHSILSNALRICGRLVEAENVAHQGMDALPQAKYANEAARTTRAALWINVAMTACERGAQARQRKAVDAGLLEVEGGETTAARVRRTWLLALKPGPIDGSDRKSLASASLLADLRDDPLCYSHVTRAQAWVALDVGDLLRARKLLSELDPMHIPELNQYLRILDQGLVERGAGRMLDAEAYFQKAISIGRNTEGGITSAASPLIRLWLERGELETAEHVATESLRTIEPSDVTTKEIALALLAHARGDEPRAEEHMRLCTRDAARFGLDDAHLRANAQLCEFGIDAHEAKLADGPPIEKLCADLDVAEDVSRTLTDNDPPPWYTIRFLVLRANLLVRTDRRTAAIDLARRAVDLARTTCEDLIPETGRILADHLLRAATTGEATPADALAVLASVEPEAEARGFLKELVRIRAARVLAFVLAGEPPAVIEPAMAALREALEHTGAPRIKADTLLDLAIRLPPETTVPDPLAIATETHALFVEMPMPAKEARSLELAGDVLAARGKTPEARRRYVTAKSILERRGLNLRVPLLTSKIEGLP